MFKDKLQRYSFISPLSNILLWPRKIKKNQHTRPIKCICTYTDLQAHSHHVHIKYQSHWYWQESLPFTLMRPDSSPSPILPDIYRGDNQSTGLSSPHLTRNAGQTQSTACKDCTNAWLVNRLKFAWVTACQKYSNKTVSNKKCSLDRFEIRKMS